MSVLNLLDDFTLVIIIVAVSALTLSVAAVVSKYVFTVLRNVQRCLRSFPQLPDKRCRPLLNCSHRRLGVLYQAAYTKAKRILTLATAVTLLYCLFFSCSHNACKMPHAPSATRVSLAASYLCICKVESDSDSVMVVRHNVELSDRTSLVGNSQLPQI